LTASWTSPVGSTSSLGVTVSVALPPAVVVGLVVTVKLFADW
jgi:hypothetical protein